MSYHLLRYCYFAEIVHTALCRMMLALWFVYILRTLIGGSLVEKKFVVRKLTGQKSGGLAFIDKKSNLSRFPFLAE